MLDVAHPAAHERLMAALRASRCGTWRWDVPRDVVEWDEALCGVYGIPRHRAPRTSPGRVAVRITMRSACTVWGSPS